MCCKERCDGSDSVCGLEDFVNNEIVGYLKLEDTFFHTPKKSFDPEEYIRVLRFNDVRVSQLGYAMYSQYLTR